MPKNTFKIFAGLFIMACLFQIVGWGKFYHLDFWLWADQAKYFETGDARQFDAAYAHPGGPVILGTLVIKKTFKLSHEDSLLIFLAFFCSLIIASTASLAYILRRDIPWWLAAFSVLSLNRIYVYSTPPSTLASLLAAFLCLFTFFLHLNKEKVRMYHLLFWAFVFGFLMATRIDIGIVSFIFFSYILRNYFDLRKLLFVSLASLFAFIIFNPFMWFMPCEHVTDLLFKIVYHYSGFGYTPFSLKRILNVSGLIAFSMALFLVTLFIGRKQERPVPIQFMMPLLAMTAILFFIYLSSEYKADRYFLPLSLIWEIFLPLFLFSLLPGLQGRLSKFEIPNRPKEKQDYLYLFLTIIIITYPLALHFIVVMREKGYFYLW